MPMREDRVDRDVLGHRDEVVEVRIRVRQQREDDDQDDQRDEGAQLEQQLNEPQPTRTGRWRRRGAVGRSATRRS